MSRWSTARSMDRATAGGRGVSTTLPPLPRTRKTRWPCSSPRSSMSAPQASKIRSPSRPSMATSAKSSGLDDRRAVTSIASNCRWVSPSVGDSGGTLGRRTYSAGEWASTASMTQVRKKPATTAMRRLTVEGVKRRTSCIHRTYSSLCARGLPAGRGGARGTRSGRARRSDSVCIPGLALEPGEVGGDRQPQPARGRRQQDGDQDVTRSSHDRASARATAPTNPQASTACGM